MKVAEAALPALQKLPTPWFARESRRGNHGAYYGCLGNSSPLRWPLARRSGCQASLLESVNLLKVVLMRFLPVLAAVALWEMGRGMVKMVQDIRETKRAIEEMNRQSAQLQQLTAAMEELANTGALSVKTQMWLAAEAAERLKAALPGAAEALRAIRGAATQAGIAISQALDAETKKAAETVKQLSAAYKQVGADIKAIWDARVTEIESNYKRQEAAAQNAVRSESVAIRASAQDLLAAEREKLSAVESGSRQMESAWKMTYGQAVALARAAGQDVQAIERQAVDARIGIYSQLESAYRSTVDRLIAEEQRHLAAAKAADEARLNLRLSVEDRIRELSRKGMDEYATYQDRLRQIDEKQAQARAALAAGNYEQARKLAEEAIALAERSASAVTRKVEENGKSITQTVVTDAQAAATAIGQIKESAGIADAALQGLGEAHKQAASAAGAGADEAKRALASVSDELGKLRQQLLQDTLKPISISGEGRHREVEGVDRGTALVAKIEADTKGAEASLAKLKTDTGNLVLVAQVEADTGKVLGHRRDQAHACRRQRRDPDARVVRSATNAACFVCGGCARRSAPTEATHTRSPI